VECRIVPFFPGRRPTDEDVRAGFGSSDGAALVTGAASDNRVVVLLEAVGLPPEAVVDATVTVDGQPLPGWDRRPVQITARARQRLELWPDRDLAGVELGFGNGFLRRAQVVVRVSSQGRTLASDEAWLDVCDVRTLGSLYQRVVDELIGPDTTRQAHQAGAPDPGVGYHPWYPVLRIGGGKAALYTAALVADIVDKQHHLTDPIWLLRVGVCLELLTCMGIVEAVRDDVGDLLTPHERDAFDHGLALAPIRERIDPDAWRQVWSMRRISFPRLGSPRTGPVSALNLLRKRAATLRFLDVHHEDLKRALELVGHNRFNSQETWQRVFRDAERAVMRHAGDAFPELGFLPAPAREVVLWQRLGMAGQQGVYPTACNKYRASMNDVADWAKDRGLMDHAGDECIPLAASLLTAYPRDQDRIAMLQRQDGLGPHLTIAEPAVVAEPTTGEIQRLLGEVPIFKMMSVEEIGALAAGARPLLLGPTQRFVVEGHHGTSLFLIADGEVEVRRRNTDGSDWLVETMGRGQVVGEMALLTGETRSATVRSVDETIVYEIGRHQYEPLLRAHPEWHDELAAVMAQRLERRATRISELETTSRSEALLQRIRRSLLG